jgi:hypothetical protein
MKSIKEIHKIFEEKRERQGRWMKVGQIQWILFIMCMVDIKFLGVWILSFFLENKE